MNQDLYRLIYYSKNSISGPPASIAAEIEVILSASQKNNARDHVTGALIFNSGIFAQVLEGTRVAIEKVFERIQRDERHGDVMVLAFEHAAQRSFPSWSMGFVGRSLEGRNLFGHVAEVSGFEGKRLEGERIFNIMRDLALEDEDRSAA